MKEDDEKVDEMKNNEEEEEVDEMKNDKEEDATAEERTGHDWVKQSWGVR